MRRFTARTGWCVPALGTTPLPDEPVMPTTSTAPDEEPGARERQERELDGRREAAGRRDVLRLLDRLAIELGQPVDERAVGELLGAGMIGVVVVLVERGVAQAEVAREIDDARARRHQLGHLRRAHLVRQPEEDDVHPRGGLGGRDALELEVGEPLEVRMGRRERLADEVDRRDAHELDVGVEEEAPDELSAAVAAAADDGGLEALRHGRAG